MAVTQGKSPIVMTATTDSIGDDGKHWFVTSIQFINSSSGAGNFRLLDKAGGQTLAQSLNQAASTKTETTVGHWIDGAYLENLPSGGQVLIFYR